MKIVGNFVVDIDLSILIAFDNGSKVGWEPAYREDEPQKLDMERSSKIQGIDQVADIEELWAACHGENLQKNFGKSTRERPEKSVRTQEWEATCTFATSFGILDWSVPKR